MVSRERIVQVALGLLAEGGLGALSMRRLADELGVRVNTIYWHVPSKQELLAAVGEAIVTAPAPVSDPDPAGADPVKGERVDVERVEMARAGATRAALELRSRMLAVRDGAEVVALARAKHPGGLAPTQEITAALTPVLGEGAAQAAEVVAVFVIGATIEEQNRRELERVDPGTSPGDDLDREALTRRGLDALLVGLVAPS